MSFTEATCKITDKVSRTKTPPIKAKTSSCLTITAITPSAAPKPKEPTSPMKISAGYVLNHRKPSPRILVCVPCGSTQVERRAIRESVLGAGAREVYLIDEPMAAAIGTGLPVDKATGSMIVDIGGGTTEVAIISLNGIVYSASVRIGGNRFDETIVNYIRRNYGILVGESTAEYIKQEIGTAFPDTTVKELEVRGRNIAEGIPRSFSINSNEILEALQEPLSGIITSIRTALEQVPPELSADIAESGMALTGGGALLKGLDRLLTEETGLPVTVADDPLTCVARGGGHVLEMAESLEDIFLTE